MEEYWVTREGARIAVGSMSEEHVKNALRMLIRRDRERAEELERIADDCRRALDEIGMAEAGDRLP